MSKERGMFTLIARAAVPDLGLREGDIISIEPGAPEPILLHRDVPEDRRAIADAVEAGALELLRPEKASRLDVYLARRLLPGPIDVEAALAALADPAPASIKEPSAWSLPLDLNGRVRLSRANNRIAKKTPRTCHCCGEQFVSKAPSAATCAVCKGAGQKRCTGCHEVFSSLGRGSYRKCERCRGKGGAA